MISGQLCPDGRVHHERVWESSLVLLARLSIAEQPGSGMAEHLVGHLLVAICPLANRKLPRSQNMMRRTAVSSRQALA
jgi:hypothetical protein